MIRLGFVVVLLAAAAVFVIYGLRYRAVPWQTPHRVDWCGAIWEREDDAPGPDRGPRYAVTRQPPLVGTRFFSPFSPAERERRSRGELARPCGGELFTVEGGRRVRYLAPG